MRPVRVDWRAALVYVTREPAWKQRIGVGGLTMLLVPPVGWVLALGYRSLVGNRLVDGTTPLLPPWRGHTAMAFGRGARSVGVTLTYLTPFMVTYWLAGARSADALIEHWSELARFVVAVVVFPPLALPGLPILYAVRYEWLHFSAGETAVLLVLFFGPILLLPAAFLQVAQHRRFTAALDVMSALRLIAAVPRLYAEAWIVSLAISAACVAIVPLMPWLLFWSYLAISHLFLQVLARVQDNERGRRAAPQLQQVLT